MGIMRVVFDVFTSWADVGAPGKFTPFRNADDCDMNCAPRSVASVRLGNKNLLHISQPISRGQRKPPTLREADWRYATYDNVILLQPRHAVAKLPYGQLCCRQFYPTYHLPLHYEVPSPRSTE